MRYATIFFVPMVILGASAAAGENLYPDPSFERTGVAGVARTGTRAGHLKVGPLIHWKAIGGRVKVEPFATYRATAWVRAKPGKGTLYGLYCYTWNSFDWAFAEMVPLRAGDGWREISATFVSPNDHMFVHPLAALDAAGAEAWVDDVILEKVNSPAQTMKELLAGPPGGKWDITLRMYWHLSRGELDKARRMAEKGDDYVKADLACQLAKRAADAGERRRRTAEMIAYGGLGYGIGRTRFAELTAGATDEEIEGILEAATKNPGRPAAVRAYVALLSERVDKAAREGTCNDAEEAIARIATKVSAVATASTASNSGGKELAAMSKKIAAARKAVAARRAGLGKCVISIGGKTIHPKTHAIAVPDKPTPQERFAAKDLQAHLERLTGKAPAIVPESKLGARTPIAIGRCPAVLKKLGVRIDFGKLGLEGIVIRTRGPALILAGNKRGVLYATYSFLEDYCGCKWFAPDCTVIPGEGTFRIADVNVRYVPPLEYRSTDYPRSRPAEWAVRNKINGTQTHLTERHGGKIAYSHFVHTFNSILNPAQHFAAHPEYFSMIKGKRVGGRTQLCLTNPEVLEIAKKTVRRWIAEAPQATIFSVSQNDWHNYCQCPKCKALAEKEGSQAGPLIHFVNALADDIAKDHPDKLISTLAYQYTRKPPRHVRPRPNVCVRLCSIECCFAHPLDKCPTNRTFVDDIRNWNKICDRLYIWDYVINYAHSVQPFPNLYSLKPNIRFFIRNGVKGIYEEACYFTKGSELAELRTWIMAKTLWNPAYDTDKAIDEFLAGYYGPAAAPIRKYINLVHKQVRDHPDWHANIWSPPTAPYLNRRVLAQSAKYFDQAEAAVKDDPPLLHRVRVARLPIQYVQIMTASRGYRERPSALVSTTGEDISTMIDRFEATARKEGLVTVREHRAVGDLNVWLRRVRRTGKTIPIVRLENAKLSLAVLPGVGGRIWRLTYKPTGRDVLKRYKAKDGSEVPDAGGYEEYSQGDYRSAGWNERYRVVSKSAAAATLEAPLANGLRLRRTIRLAGDAAQVEIHSTLTNAGKGAVQACLRAHPCFAVKDVAAATVAIVREDGKAIVKKLAIPAGRPQEQDEWLTGKDTPQGQWSLTAGDRFVITCRFDRKQVEKYLLNRSIPDGRVNLELFTRQATLKPGESLELTHSIEVQKTQQGGRGGAK